MPPKKFSKRNFIELGEKGNSQLMLDFGAGDGACSLGDRPLGISVSSVDTTRSEFFDKKLMRSFFLELLGTNTAYGVSNKDGSIETLFAKNHTIQNYKSDIKKFVSFLISCKFPLEASKLTYGDHVLYYKTFLASSFAPKTVHRNLVALRRFWDFLVNQKFVASNIFDRVKTKHANPIRPTNALNEEQIKKIFEVIESNPNPIEKVFERMIFYLFLGTGARKSELLSLRREDFMRKQGISHLVLKGKRGKIREVPLLDAVKVCIEDYLLMMESKRRAISDKDLLVQNQYNRSGGCSDEVIERIIKKYVLAAGIDERITPHSLRASVITHLYTKGLDVVDISQYVGHASVETTKGYIKRAKKIEESPGLKISLF
ncbi:MAG: tyrosine-type recombinase/integrase [Oligoflexia bacterium]|nr:tyrosine-type recombinase/integrase [Oligoflexia bacterium]